MFFQITMCPSETPTAASRQGVVLAIKGNDSGCGFSGDAAGASAPSPVVNVIAEFKPMLPARYGSLMTSDDAANGCLGNLKLQ